MPSDQHLAILGDQVQSRNQGAGNGYSQVGSIFLDLRFSSDELETFSQTVETQELAKKAC